MSDLVGRLRSRKGEAITRTEKLMDEAADRIEAIEKSVAEMRGNLSDIKGLIERRHESGDLVDGGDLHGVTTIRHEQRIEDDAIVFGSYIDGVWHESHRMTFGGDKETKALALVALSQVSK